MFQRAHPNFEKIHGSVEKPTPIRNTKCLGCRKQAVGDLAIPWKSRNITNAKGTLFKQYYLLRAKNIDSAFRKAMRILLVCEHCDGDGWLNGKRVIFKKIGVLDLQPFYE